MNLRKTTKILSQSNRSQRRVSALVHSPVFWKLENTTPQVSGVTPTLLGPFERANFNHRVGVSLSPEDGNRSSFRGFVFSSF
jgi:hypothetical protein